MWKWSSYLNKNTLKAPVRRQYTLFREVIATYGILNTHTSHMSKMQDILMSLPAVTYSYHTDLGWRGWRGRRKNYRKRGSTPYLTTVFVPWSLKLDTIENVFNRIAGWCCRCGRSGRHVVAVQTTKLHANDKTLTFTYSYRNSISCSWNATVVRENAL